MKTKSIAFYVGVLVILFGFWISTNPYAIIIGVPIFIIGVLILLYSNMKTWVKAVWIVIPIILWIPATLFLPNLYVLLTPRSIYLIPENFRGNIVVFYNEQCGEELTRGEDGWEYRIPNDGILILKKKFKAGYINEKYYLTKINGERKELPMFYGSYRDNADKALPNEIGCFVRGVTTGSDLGYSYRSMTISNYDSVERYYQLTFEQKFDSLKDTKLINCRQQVLEK